MVTAIYQIFWILSALCESTCTRPYGVYEVVQDMTPGLKELVI